MKSFKRVIPKIDFDVFEFGMSCPESKFSNTIRHD